MTTEPTIAPPSAPGWAVFDRTDVGTMYQHRGLRLRVLVDKNIAGLLSVSRMGKVPKRPRPPELERVRRDWGLEGWPEVRRTKMHVMLMEPGAYKARVQRGEG